MPKAKPKWGFFPHIISKDLDHSPKKKEIEELMDDLSGMLKVSLKTINNEQVKHPENKTITFYDFLYSLVNEYRERVLNDRHGPTKASIQETLSYLENIANEMEKRFEPLSLDSGLDFETLDLLDQHFPENHRGFAQFHEDGIMIKKAIKKARKELDQTEDNVGRKSDFEHKVWLAKNLILTFKCLLGIRTTKTRGSKLDHTISRLLKTCGFEQGKYIVSGYAPEQNFKVIKAAMDEIKQGKRAVDPWKTHKLIKFKRDASKIRYQNG